MIFPQTTVSTANVHRLPSLGRSVQVIVVWLVVLRQLPQFDARMLYWTAGQSGATGFQLKVISFGPELTRAKEISSGGGNGTVTAFGNYCINKQKCSDVQELPHMYVQCCIKNSYQIL